MRLRRAAAATLLAAALLTGCGTPFGSAGAPVAAPMTASSPLPATPVSDGSSAPPSVGATQTLSVDQVSVDVTVHDLVRATAGAQLNGGQTVPVTNDLINVDVEACIHGYDGTVQAQDRWQLVDASNGRYQPEIHPAEGLTPEYPYFPESILDGECVRGWMSFLVGKDPVATVRYTTGNGYTLRWSAG